MESNYNMNSGISAERNAGYFPFEYFAHFLEFLRARDDIFEFITYNDLPWGDDFDSVNSFPQEHKNWKKQLKSGKRDSRKIYVLLQHDVDSVPERTMDILREEQRLGIRSNVMIFRRRVNRRHLQNTGEILYTEYALDYDYLRRLQDESGFVIAYHCNAYDQSAFDMDKAVSIFEEDVESLRQHLDIQYFSPHGGARGPSGTINTDVPIPRSLQRNLRWVCNTRTVRFDGHYSDGGVNSPKRDPKERDLRDFVSGWKPGRRYRILLHPQYYHTPCQPSPRLTGTRWYDELLEFYASGKPGTGWDDVQLACFAQKKVDMIRRLRRLWG